MKISYQEYTFMGVEGLKSERGGAGWERVGESTAENDEYYCIK